MMWLPEYNNKKQRHNKGKNRQTALRNLKTFVRCKSFLSASLVLTSVNMEERRPCRRKLYLTGGDEATLTIHKRRRREREIE